MIELNCPLIILDLETTGTASVVDRVIQVGLIKLLPDGTRTEWETLVNPECHITAEATECHGITDETVRDAPKFREIAHVLHKGFQGCDVGGFNVTFDVKFLDAEFQRVKLPPLQPRILDAFKIHCDYRPRDLTSCVREYLGEEMVGAHDALTDARYTLRVLEAQLAAHPKLPRTMEELHRKYFETPEPGYVDVERKFAWRDGVPVFNFGKHGETATPLSKVDHGYLRWMINSEFSEGVKQICRDAMRGVFPKKEPK